MWRFGNTKPIKFWDVDVDRIVVSKLIVMYYTSYKYKFYTNFRGLNFPEGGVECESFSIISIDYLLVYENKYYLKVY